MNNASTPKQSPRGFISLEAGAEVLWRDETDREPFWGIAFLQIVADSQGVTDTGKRPDVSLQWWKADVNSPILVRARDIPSLWPAFREWCGLPVIGNDPASTSKPRRGRPKGSTISGDDVLVNAAIDLWRTGQANSLTAAARIVSKHADGASREAKYDRLRRKVLAKWRKRCATENN